MSFPELTLRGVLLNSENTGENFSRLSIFSKKGLQLCLLRKTRGKNATSHPGFLDEVEITLNPSKSGGIPFVKEYIIVHKRIDLGVRRETFESAGILARFYLLNGEHLLEPKLFHEILSKALISFSSGGNPSIILFKALFLFASKEGVAVKESWLHSQERETHLLITSILQTPVKDAGKLSPQVSKILDSLLKWFQTETEFIC